MVLELSVAVQPVFGAKVVDELWEAEERKKILFAWRQSLR
jgi:hypothetical protein